MKNEKKQVLINAIDFEDSEPTSVLIRLMVETNMKKPEIEHAIRLACLEYCQSEGKQRSFNYGDFDALVPNDICEKYGITKLEIPYEQIYVPYGTNLIAEPCEHAAGKKMTFHEYVEAECKRQWKELQEEENGPWENLPENERKAYFEEMYEHLLPQKKELRDMDDIID